MVMFQTCIHVFKFSLVSQFLYPIKSDGRQHATRLIGIIWDSVSTQLNKIGNNCLVIVLDVSINLLSLVKSAH